VALATQVRRRPLAVLLALVALVAGLVVVAYPLAVTRYAPMTDLPFHAAQTSAFRHYIDPDFHLREQFELHPLSVPYVSMYAIGAFFMLFLPAHVAIKIAAAAMLALLPAGLSVMFHGMKKSPLLGLLGLPLVWNPLTHWGFLNFLGALGLFAMAIGVTLLLLDKPTRRRQIALSAVLVLLFFTHVFRFPFALCGVVGAAIVMYPATRRLRPILLPLALPLVLMVVWLRVRPAAIGGPIDLSHFEPARLAELPRLVFEGGFDDPAEARAIERAARAVGLVVAASAVAFAAEGRLSGRTRRAWAWGAGVTIVPLACAGAFLLLFLILPMQTGVWWYVYPREAVAAAFIALGAAPDLPKRGLLRAPLVVAVALASAGLGRVIADDYRRFDRATADFQAITQRIPQAPKLLYLVFEHGGSNRKNTPFIHLPAYVQAEKGGWLSFHFAVFGASPVAYRAPTDPGAVIPPPVPVRWEWTPQRFRVSEHGPFFDWFLVRARRSPDEIFRADPTIVPVDHQGTWWLYRRDRTKPAPLP
jgi:hypothetical protein